MRQLRNSPEHYQRGAVLVEMALVLPILLVLFVGIVDFGLILREYQILQNAAREGARLSTLPSYSIRDSDEPNDIEAAIQSRVVDYLAQEQITIAAGDVTVNQDATIDLGGVAASASQITVVYSRSLLIGNGWPFAPISLKGEAIFRNLY
jgi:Flp pilus assembly protein TadG